jgi:hypothetical protein
MVSWPTPSTGLSGGASVKKHFCEFFSKFWLSGNLTAGIKTQRQKVLLCCRSGLQREL